MGRRPDRGVVVITVGDEVLGGFTLDTNSNWLATTLREAGWPVLRIEVVGDAEPDIADAVRRAVADPRAERIVVTGGLGPTPDDLTLDAVAGALGLPVEENADSLAHVRALMERMRDAGWVGTAEITPANRKMVMAPRGATSLPNRRGMASGIAVPIPGAPGRILLMLPGVPRELQVIVTEEALPRLFAGGVTRTVVELHYRHAIEAQFTGPMELLGEEFPDVSVGSYPQTETRELVIRVGGEDADRVRAAVDRLTGLRPLPSAVP